MKEGWKCPLCGNVYAPFVQKCPEVHGFAAFPEVPMQPLLEACAHEWRDNTAGRSCWKCGKKA